MATPRICSIENCGKKVFARGWCSRHWHRWRYHGDPLKGGTANGEPLQYFQETILTYEGNECLTWPYATNSAGYAHMYVDGRTQLISRLICSEVYGPAPPNHEAAHECGKGHLACVAKRHLSWKTPVSNAADRVGHGTQYRADLTDAQVREIRALRGVVSQFKIAAKFGIHQTVVSRIQLGKAWSWVP
jgi:hypothetical protein